MNDRHQRARPRAADLHGADRLALRSGRRRRRRCASGRRPTAPAGSAARPRTTTASTAWTWRSSRPSCARRSRRRPRRSTSASDGPTRRKFLARLQGEISKRGTIDVLRHGIKHGPHHLDLFYGTPSPGNAKAAERYAAEPLQRHAPAPLQPRRDAARARPGLFINGLPVATFELKNSLTKQTVEDAVAAVQARPRPAREALRVRPLRRALRRGRPRGALLHAPEGQGLVVPALQPGLERRRGQSAQPERPQDRLPLEAHPHPRRPDRHPRELRPGRRDEGREDRQEEGGADLAALPPARRGAQAPGRRAGSTARAGAT